MLTRQSVLLLLLAMISPGAWAYLDGGTGSMLLQVILGGLAGLAVATRLWWHRIVLFFSGKKNK